MLARIEPRPASAPFARNAATRTRFTRPGAAGDSERGRAAGGAACVRAALGRGALRERRPGQRSQRLARIELRSASPFFVAPAHPRNAIVQPVIASGACLRLVGRALLLYPQDVS
jgi:hypothetical protein